MIWSCVRHKKTGDLGRVKSVTARGYKVETLGVGGVWGGASSSTLIWKKADVEVLDTDPSIPLREEEARRVRASAALRKLEKVKWFENELLLQALEAFAAVAEKDTHKGSPR